MTSAVAFDIGLLLSQATMDSIAQQVYTSNPGIFKGTTTGSSQGVAYTIGYQVNQPPTFDLSPSNPAAVAARSVLLTRLSAAKDRTDLAPGIAAAARMISASLAAGSAPQANAFTLTNSVLFTLTIGSNPPGSPLQFIATIAATVTTSANGSLSLQATSLTLAPDQPPNAPPIDPFTLNAINTSGVPAMLSLVNGLLRSVSLPPIAVAGLSLAAPVISIMQGSLVIACVLNAQPGSPSTLTDPPAAYGGIGILLSQRLLQIAAQIGINQIVSNAPVHGSGKSGGDGFNAEYSYGLAFGSPSVSVSGTSLNLTLGLSGQASAGIEAFWIHYGVGYNAYASPTPTAHLQPSVVSGELWINLESMNTFAVVLSPTGSISSVIAGALGWLVVEPVVAAVVAAASGTIRNISFPVYKIPPITFAVSGFSVTASANNVQFEAFGSDALLYGDISIQASASHFAILDQVLTNKPARRPHRFAGDLLDTAPAAPSIPMILWQNAAVGQTFSGGLYFAGSYIVCGQATFTTLSASAATVSGSFNVDAVLDGQTVDASGTFTASATSAADNTWAVSLTALLSTGRTVNWSTTLTASYQNGSPTLSGVVSAGGSPVAVLITFQIQNQSPPNASYVYAFPQTTGPSGETLPAGYLEYPAPAASKA